MSISRYLGICLGNVDKLSYRPTYYRSTGFSSEHTNTNIEIKSDDVRARDTARDFGKNGAIESYNSARREGRYKC